MESKPAQNIQDSFLNTARKDKSVITIYLLSGVKLSGRIRSFDKYSLVLETNNQEQLIFKHAISTVVMSRGGAYAGPLGRAPRGRSSPRSGSAPRLRRRWGTTPHRNLEPIEPVRQCSPALALSHEVAPRSPFQSSSPMQEAQLENA